MRPGRLDLSKRIDCGLNEGEAVRASSAITGVVAAFIAVMTSLVLIHQQVTSAPAIPVGTTCPANAKKANLQLAFRDLTGRNVSLELYRGKVLILDFWATWCVPCQVEIPGFVDLYRTYQSAGLEVVGVSVLDDFKKVRPFVQQHGMNYTVLDGNDRDDVEKTFGPFVGLPTTLVIGRDGSICARHVGIPSLGTDSLEKSSRESFEAAVRPLL
jgi:peroxiredoxin